MTNKQQQQQNMKLKHKKKIIRQRKRISDSVHEAVCEFTHTDGARHCLFYSIAGAALAGRVFGKTYYPQAGILRVRCDPDNDEHFWGCDPTAHPDGIAAGEFHCWFASGKGTGRIKADEIVDLSSRHWRTQHAEGHNAGNLSIPEWKISEPPDFIWCQEFPQWFHLEPDEKTIRHFWGYFKEYQSQLKHLVKLAGECYRAAS